MLPMHQAEAMWLNFDSAYIPEHETSYPFAVKIAAGKIDAVTGENWTNGLHGLPQDYMVVPEQPWLDGFCVEKGMIRQFVAMPLGEGYTAEEQISGKAEHGGLQIIVYPMKREVFERRFPKVEPEDRRRHACARRQLCILHDGLVRLDMGLAPGGRMKQEIFEDPYRLRGLGPRHVEPLLRSPRQLDHVEGGHRRGAADRASDVEAVHARPACPGTTTTTPTPTALEGSEILDDLKSVIRMGYEKGEYPLPENEPARPKRVIRLRKGLARGQVREGAF